MLILIGVSFIFSMIIVLVFSQLIIRPNFLLVSSICVVISCSSGSVLVRRPMSSANRRLFIHSFIHSFIHCRHLYSASSSGATQKRSQPQRDCIILFLVAVK